MSRSYAAVASPRARCHPATPPERWGSVGDDSASVTGSVRTVADLRAEHVSLIS